MDMRTPWRDGPEPFGGAFAGRRVLVTGHTGFKGSWLVAWLQALEARVAGLALPADTRPSHHAILAPQIDEALVDLRDRAAVGAAVARFAPEVVFHLGAQALVRRSYRDPDETLATNVDGLAHLLAAVRATPSVRAVVVVTSDKCYLNRDGAAPFREDDPLGGRDPYSASKACAEIVAASWQASFLAADDGRGHPVRLATARAGNVVGGGDWAEDRLVPDLMRDAAAGRITPIRYPHATRPWQHVLEPLAGYLLLAARLLDGGAAFEGAWNFGPAADDHLSVLDVAQRLQQAWPAVRYAATADAAHPHEAHRLHLDCSKAHARLGWRPVWPAARTFELTARWYRTWTETGVAATRRDLDEYLAAARAAGLPWCRASAATPA